MAEPVSKHEKNSESAPESINSAPASAERVRSSYLRSHDSRDFARQRQTPRKVIDLSVSLYLDTRSSAAAVEDISTGGAFISTGAQLCVGETIDVAISLPDRRQILAHGVVRWIRRCQSGDRRAPGLGVQFLQLEGLHLIEELLNENEQQWLA